VSLFSRILPLESMYRVWDSFLLEGVKILHRVSLALLSRYSRTILSFQEPYEVWNAVSRDIGYDAYSYDCDELMRDGFSFSLSRAELSEYRELHGAVMRNTERGDHHQHSFKNNALIEEIEEDNSSSNEHTPLPVLNTK